LTVIFDTGDFWIESIIIPRQSVALNTEINLDTGLTRGGHFCGCSGIRDDSNPVTEEEFRTCTIKNVDDSELTYGQEIQTIRCTISNANSFSAWTFGAKFIVFMRR